MEQIKGYHKLVVWKRARELVSLIYQLTADFPKSEIFGLKGQMRRAGVSIVLNIVEGQRRSSVKEFIHFLEISMGSCSEVEAACELCLDLNFLREENQKLLLSKIHEVNYLLYSLVKSLKK